MIQACVNNESAHRPVRPALLVLLLSIAAAVPTALLGDDCPPAEALSVDDTVRRFPQSAAPDVYEVALPAPGVLALDVSAPLTEPGRARLVLAAAPCADAGESAAWSPVARTPRAAELLVLKPGLLRFAVSSEDPAVSLTSYKLSTVFAAAERLPSKGVDPWEDDDIAGLTACKAVKDDHADSPLCATPLGPGESASGRIGRAGEDDYFAFLLGDWTTVAVDLAGGAEILGVLYGADGQELASWAEGRLVRALGPGRYDVRVGGSAGAYSVVVSELP